MSEENETLDAEVVPTKDESSHEITVATDILPNTLHLLPLSERPFFPAQVLPLLLNEDPWLPTVEAIVQGQSPTLGLIM